MRGIVPRNITYVTDGIVTSLTKTIVDLSRVIRSRLRLTRTR